MSRITRVPLDEIPRRYRESPLEPLMKLIPQPGEKEGLRIETKNLAESRRLRDRMSWLARKRDIRLRFSIMSDALYIWRRPDRNAKQKGALDE